LALKAFSPFAPVCNRSSSDRFQPPARIDAPARRAAVHRSH